MPTSVSLSGYLCVAPTHGFNVAIESSEAEQVLFATDTRLEVGSAGQSQYMSSR